MRKEMLAPCAIIQFGTYVCATSSDKIMNHVIHVHFDVVILCRVGIDSTLDKFAIIYSKPARYNITGFSIRLFVWIRIRIWFEALWSVPLSVHISSRYVTNSNSNHLSL
eukprot:160967_1